MRERERTCLASTLHKLATHYSQDLRLPVEAAKGAHSLTTQPFLMVEDKTPHRAFRGGTTAQQTALCLLVHECDRLRKHHPTCVCY